MPSAALERAKDQVARLRRSNAIARASGKGKPLVRAGAVVAGSGLAGALNAKMPDGIAGIESTLLVGPLMILGGIFGLKGQAGEGLMLAGAGVLGSFVDRWVEDQLTEG